MLLTLPCVPLFQRLLLAQVPREHGRRFVTSSVFNRPEEPVLEELERVQLSPAAHTFIQIHAAAHISL